MNEYTYAEKPGTLTPEQAHQILMEDGKVYVHEPWFTGPVPVERGPFLGVNRETRVYLCTAHLMGWPITAE